MTRLGSPNFPAKWQSWYVPRQISKAIHHFLVWGHTYYYLEAFPRLRISPRSGAWWTIWCQGMNLDLLHATHAPRISVISAWCPPDAHIHLTMRTDWEGQCRAVGQTYLFITPNNPISYSCSSCPSWTWDPHSQAGQSSLLRRPLHLTQF